MVWLDRLDIELFKKWGKIFSKYLSVKHEDSYLHVAIVCMYPSFQVQLWISNRHLVVLLFLLFVWVSDCSLSLSTECEGFRACLSDHLRQSWYHWLETRTLACVPALLSWREAAAAAEGDGGQSYSDSEGLQRISYTQVVSEIRYSVYICCRNYVDVRKHYSYIIFLRIVASQSDSEQNKRFM